LENQRRTAAEEACLGEQGRDAAHVYSVSLAGHRIPLALNLHLVHKPWRDDVLSETLLLQQFQRAQCRAGVATEHQSARPRTTSDHTLHLLQKLDVLGLLEVLQVAEIGHELGLVEVLLRG
jgi:hypothetical protein